MGDEAWSGHVGKARSGTSFVFTVDILGLYRFDVDAGVVSLLVVNVSNGNCKA